MKIDPKAKCRTCKGEMTAHQITLQPGGHVLEFHFCPSCNEKNQGYKPRIMEVYRPGQ